MTKPERGEDRFGRVVGELLRERGYETRLGQPDWMGFAREHGINYESLRKAVVGDRVPSEALMEAVAAVLDVKPDVFAEYELAQWRKQFNPKEVGIDAALDAMRRYRAEGG